MANNVQNIIEIEHKGDGRVDEFLQKIQSLFERDGSISDLFSSSEDTRQWWENAIGAKWAYIEDFELHENYCRLTMVSAWSPLEPFVEYIDDQTGNSAKITFQYIDEMPNFAGYTIRDRGDIIEEKDFPDMWDMIDEEADIRKKAENLTFSDESTENDWKWDWMWDFVYDTVDPENNNA